MLIKKTGPIFLALLPFLFACDDNEPIARDDDFSLASLNVDYAEIPLEGFIFRDSIITSNSGFMMSGHTFDPKFGEITAEGYTQLRIEIGNNVDSVAGGDIADSVQLFLFFDDFYYPYAGESTEFIEVYQLDEKLEGYDFASTDTSRINYYGTQKRAASRFLGRDSITIDENFNPGGRLIRIDLDTQFGQDILDDYANSPGSNYDDLQRQDLFQDDVKGIAFKGVSSNKTIFSFAANPNPNRSFIRLYYHKPNETFSRSLAFNFFTFVTNFNNFGVQYNFLEVDPAGTDLPSNIPWQQPLSSPNGELYVQSSTGFKAGVRLDNFYNYFDTLDKKSLQFVRADLVLGDIEIPREERQLLPTSLRFQFYNKQNALDSTLSTMVDLVRLFNSGGRDVVAADARFQRNDLADTGFYSEDLFSFLSDQLEREQHRRSNYLLVVANPINYSARRVVLPESGLKLRIYYTTVN